MFYKFYKFSQSTLASKCHVNVSSHEILGTRITDSQFPESPHVRK